MNREKKGGEKKREKKGSSETQTNFLVDAEHQQGPRSGERRRGTREGKKKGKGRRGGLVGEQR